MLTRPLLRNQQWNAVALWAWDIVVDNCAICRNHIMDLCALYLLPNTANLETDADRLNRCHNRYRVPGQPSICYQRGVHSCLGNLQREFSQTPRALVSLSYGAAIQ